MARREATPARRRLLFQAGLLFAVLILNGVVGVMALAYLNARHTANLDTLQRLDQAVDAARLAQTHFKTQVQEWKNVLLRGFDPEDRQFYWGSFEAQERLVEEYLQRAHDLALVAGLGNGDLARLNAHHRELSARYRAALEGFDASRADGHRPVDREVRGMDRELQRELDAYADKLRQEASRIPARIEGETRERYRTLGWISFFTITLGFLLIVWFVFSAMNRDQGSPARYNPATKEFT